MVQSINCGTNRRNFMKKFSARDNQAFWEHESSYNGDVVSFTIVSLIKSYVGSVVLDY